MESVRWGDAKLTVAADSRRSWFFKEPVTGIAGPLKLEGTAPSGTLPFALRIEIEVEGEPTLKWMEWVETSPFQIIIHPSWEEGP
ncbi:MAG: hypothetical protein ACQKBT_12605 [Puniceicoccales bacterium]